MPDITQCDVFVTNLCAISSGVVIVILLHTLDLSIIKFIIIIMNARTVFIIVYSVVYNQSEHSEITGK